MNRLIRSKFSVISSGSLARNSAALLASIGFGFALPGVVCHAKGPKEAPAPIFFPVPPDEPRIQFLAGFSTEEEMTEMAGKRSFFRFIVGTEKIQRPIVKPYGIAATPGKFYICDTVPATIEIVDFDKHKLSYFQPTGDATFGTPINIAVDADETLYVSDTKRNQVLIFKGEQYAGAIGKLNEMKPVGIALTEKRIYVTDLMNHCVRVYDKATRNELFTFPKVDELDVSAELYSPTNIAIDKGGRVIVSDTGGFVVKIYDAEGRYLKTVGEQGLSPGTFSLPKGVAVDREGRTYVVDANTQIIQIFDAEGRILMYFGDPSLTGGGATSLPAGIAIDYDNVKRFEQFAAPGFALEYLILITNQTGGHKVSVFGFGHKK